MAKIDWFWDIIHQANKDREKLRIILTALSKEQIVLFQDIFVELSVELQDEPYTDYMAESEDGMEDVSYWVVSTGKEYYSNILDNPSSIPYSVDDQIEEVLYGIADEICYAKYNESTGIY